MEVLAKNEIGIILDKYSKIQLNELSEAELMQRVDIKFLFNIKKLPSVLEKIRSEYMSLDIAGESIYNYKTVYYDTPNLKCFNDAKVKRPNRFKIRKRIYLNSDLGFIELKKKIKGLRTDKIRVKSTTDIILEDLIESKGHKYFSQKEQDFLSGEGVNNLHDFYPNLDIRYKRISLVSQNKKERVTLDYDVQIMMNDRSVSFDGLVIAELKKSRLTSESPFLKAIKGMDIEKRRVSKYALGIVLLNDNIGHQRYKTKISKIESISNIIYGTRNS